MNSSANLLLSESQEVHHHHHDYSNSTDSDSDIEQHTSNNEPSSDMAYRKDSKYWFICDPCGIVCAVMTYILIVYGELVVLIVLAPPFPTLGTFICTAIFTTLAVLSVVSHVKSMITDPVSTVIICVSSVCEMCVCRDHCPVRLLFGDCSANIWSLQIQLTVPPPHNL